MAPAVIASAARQSMQSEVMDRHVAALLAMTVFLVQGRCAVSGRIQGARKDKHLSYFGVVLSNVS
jgi:hypothetical protein